mmetsp:Transcript_14156/g.29694  ORF Transcript_14156/g.29694 Transcript_14156/m.29694 type:complete len:252 (-) Transcript_14156:852-1607(-)
MHRLQVRVRHVLEACRSEDEIRVSARSRDSDEGTLVVAGVEVVRSAEDTAQLGVVPTEAGCFHLVRAHNALQTVLLAEGVSHVRAEHVDALPLSVRWPVPRATTGVAPEDVDDLACVVHQLVVRRRPDGVHVRFRGNLHVAVDASDLLERGQPGHRDGIGRVMCLPWHPDPGVGPGQARMEDQDLLVDEVAKRQVPEGLREQIEELHVVLRPNLSAKSVEDVRLEHLVVPSIQEHEAGILQFEGEEHSDDL